MRRTWRTWATPKPPCKGRKTKMNDHMKVLTIAAIFVALYVLLRHAGAQQLNSSGTKTQILPQAILETSPCGAPIPLQTSTCDIPLAADYLYVGVPYNPATAPINTREILMQPIDAEATIYSFAGPVNVPYGTHGETVTPVSGTCANVFTVGCADLTATESCVPVKV